MRGIAGTFDAGELTTGKGIATTRSTLLRQLLHSSSTACFSIFLQVLCAIHDATTALLLVVFRFSFVFDAQSTILRQLLYSSFTACFSIFFVFDVQSTVLRQLLYCSFTSAG